MEDLKLCESEYRFMQIIWDHAPMTSRRLVELCDAKLGWKKSTTYTTLKKLCEKGFAKNEDTMVTALVPREQVQAYESARVVDRAFSGSLPGFLTAFLGGRGISEQEAAELKRIIDEHQEG